jgi:hypothetical protein
MPETQDQRIDRLYALLPAIYRMRDAGQGYPLKALLRVIAEQVNIVEDDIAGLYENWFIETADDWAVPYIADLIGYRPVTGAGVPGDPATPEGEALNRVLVPRREVANTIRYRRRKGTLALLELLSNDIANWPARAVEFFKLLGWTQNLNHQHPERARPADLRDVETLDLLEGPFCRSAHSVDVRRIDSHRTVSYRNNNRHNIPNVGLYVWRLKPYSVTEAPAYCAENVGPHCYTFSVLGQDAPLFVRSEAQTDPSAIAGELHVPAPIRRLAFERHMKRFYGEGKSLAIWAEGWPQASAEQPVAISQIIAADLTDWQYKPPRNHIAVDPVLGRFAFPPSQLPRKGVRVSYLYAFPDDLGGGEYARKVYDPHPREVNGEMVSPKFYRVGRDAEFARIGDAIGKWKDEAPADAVIEIVDSSVYVEPVYIALAESQSLQLRAASGARPTIRLLDWQTDLPDAMAVTMSHASRFTLDGVLITGRALHVSGPNASKGELPEDPACHAELVIRHCTLVPGWRLESDCRPKRPAEPSLELYNVRARVTVEHSILGSIQIHQNAVREDPLPLYIADSILDATDPEKEAIGSPGYAVAHAVLTIKRSTVFGITDVHAIELAEDSIFMDCLNVARRQLGCMRFCYVPCGCRTPRRYRCQPDMVISAVRKRISDPVQQAAEIACEKLRVRPQFTSTHYGHPAYAQLGFHCATEIERGASDESEMGAYHNLYQPQREAILAARLDEFTPADAEAGILFAN